MTEEMTPREDRARKFADSQLKKIRSKYLNDVIQDDGNSDSLAYACSQLTYEFEAESKIDIERWTDAIALATNGKSPDWSLLRKEIEFDAKGFITTANTKDWENYGHALFNLADSIIG